MIALGFVGACVVAFAAAALLQPRLFLWMYLVLSTSAFGLIDVAGIEMAGAVNILLYLNAIAGGAAFLRICLGRHMNPAHIRASLPFLMLFTWGVIWAVVGSGSTPYHAIVDGKDLLAGVLLLYLGTVPSGKDSVGGTVISIGVVLALLVVMFRITGLIMPHYDAVSAASREEGFHFFTPTYVYLAYVLVLGFWYERARPPVWVAPVFVLLSLGIILQGHTSLAVVGVMVAVALPFVGEVRRSTFRRWVTAGAVAAIVIGVSMDAGGPATALSESARNQVTYREGSIGARITYNQFRLAAWGTRPLLGFGLLDEQASLGETLTSESTNRFTATVGTVDAGYVDLLVRFGILGTTVYLLWFGRSIFVARKVGERGATRDALTLFLLSMLVVNLVWSVLTYSHGLIAIVLAMHLMLTRSTGRTAQNVRVSDYPSPYPKLPEISAPLPGIAKSGASG